MSSFNTRDCQTAVSTIFTFDSPAFQNACNNIYTSVSTIDAAPRKNNTNYIKFKTDFERMQYKIGQFNQAPRS
jgi:hypothetical protein